MGLQPWPWLRWCWSLTCFPRQASLNSTVLPSPLPGVPTAAAGAEERHRGGAGPTTGDIGQPSPQCQLAKVMNSKQAMCKLKFSLTPECYQP